MDKMDYQPGLVRYTTLNEVSGRGLHIFRPRVFVYTAILLGLVVAMFWSLAARIPVSIDVLRDRNILYRETSAGDLENVFRIRILNQDNKPHSFVVSLEGMPGATLDRDEPETFADSGEIVETLVRVRANDDIIKERSTGITLRITASDDKKLTDDEDARFIAPADWFR
jgi:polyferredoxin